MISKRLYHFAVVIVFSLTLTPLAKQDIDGQMYPKFEASLKRIRMIGGGERWLRVLMSIWEK